MPLSNARSRRGSRRLLSSMFPLVALLTCGCTYTAVFGSSPSGARVLIDGELVGITPLTREMSTEVSSYVLRIERDGYVPQTRVISPVPTGTYISISTTYDQSPRPTYDPSAPAASTLDMVGHEVERLRRPPSTTSAQQVYAWPERVFVTLTPARALTPDVR